MRRRWGAAVAVLLAVSACSPGAEDPAVAEETADPLPTVREPAEPVPGIEAEAVQLRTDAAVGGRIQVRVTASDSFTVTSVALDSPGFAPVRPVELTAEFVPGRVIDLRTPFGRAQCDVEPEPASARLTVVRPGTQPEDVEVPLAAAVLKRIHTDECVEQALAQEVTIEVADLQQDGDGLAGSLVLVRRAGAREVQATDLGRSVLIAVEADLPLILAPEAQEAAAPLRFTSANCEPHVLSETKQPFRFPVTIQAGDATPVAVDLPIPDDVRAQLQALVQRICG
jgi:hypothetical protein